MQRLLKRVYPCVVWSPRIPNFSDSFPSLDGSFHSVTHRGRAAVKSLLIKLLFPNPLCTHFHPIYFIRPSPTMKSPYFCKFPFIQTKITKKKSLSMLRADKVLPSMLTYVILFQKLHTHAEAKGLDHLKMCQIFYISAVSVLLFAFFCRFYSSLSLSFLPFPHHASLLASLYICPLILSSAEKLLKGPMKYV